MYKAKPKNAYSILEAEKLVPITYKSLYRYIKKGMINYIQYHQANSVKYGLMIDEINRINQILAGPADCMSSARFAKLTHHTNGIILKYIRQLKLEPKVKHYNDKLSPRRDCYRLIDLMQVWQAIHDKQCQLKYRKHDEIKVFRFNSNTLTYYQPQIHYGLLKLGRLLNPQQPVTGMIICQWIIYQRIKNYNVDPNGYLYFTEQQAQALKEQYLNMPDNLAYTNQELAQKLNIEPSNLINFRKYYGIQVVKVLGRPNVFYTKADANKIIDWYQNPSHRPYPYEWNKSKAKLKLSRK